MKRLNQKGFTLIEICIALLVFAVGALAVASMLGVAIGGSGSANERSQATTIAGDKLEELLSLNYADPALSDTDSDGVNQDLNNDGIDEVGPDFNFGLLDEDAGADFEESVGSLYPGNYRIFWNVAVNEPEENTKRITVIVRWTGKGGVVHRVVLDSVKSSVDG